MQSENFVPFDDFLQALARLCQENRSGTLYCVSPKHAGFIKIKEGQIAGLRYGSKLNEAALDALKELDRVRYRFNESVVSEEECVESLESGAVLKKLGLADPISSQNQQVSAKVSLSSIRHVDSQVQSVLIELLTEYMGPVASLVSQQVFQRADTLDTAIDLLAQRLPDPEDASAFVREARQKLLQQSR